MIEIILVVGFYFIWRVLEDISESIKTYWSVWDRIADKLTDINRNLNQDKDGK